jgi:hypothetical protein
MSRPDRSNPVAYGHQALWPQGGPTWELALELLQRGTGLPAYVLAVDQAKRSGYAAVELELGRKLVLHGWAETSAQRQRALKTMRTLPGFDWSRVLVVFEDHSTIPLEFTRGQGAGAKKTVMAKRSILSLGASLGRWDELLNILEQPETQRIRVEPREWRRVLSTGCNLNTSAWKAQAKLWATGACGARIEDDNEAEACAMATWGAFDGLFTWARARLAQKASA